MMSSRRGKQHTDRLLTILHDAELPFVVVGGVAAIAHGAATSTKDLDIVIPMTSDSLNHLMSVLAPLHPMHAHRHDLGVITNSPDELSKFRLLLIDTQLGRLDVLKTVEPIGTYDELKTVKMELIEGRIFSVIDLDQLITIKAHIGRRKDLIVEQELRAIRALKNK